LKLAAVTAPVNVALVPERRPVTPKVPPTVALFVIEADASVLAPVTPKVPESVVFPVTPKVPPTVALFVIEADESVEDPADKLPRVLAPVTFKAPVRLVSLVTFNDESVLAPAPKVPENDPFVADKVPSVLAPLTNKVPDKLPLVADKAPSVLAPVTPNVPEKLPFVPVIAPADTDPIVVTPLTLSVPGTVRLPEVSTLSCVPTWPKCTSVAFPFTSKVDAHTADRCMACPTDSCVIVSSPWADVSPHFVFRTPSGPADIIRRDAAFGVETVPSHRHTI
jgi:hypothetical protein